MSTLLVTGGCGFIGQAVVHRLLTAGYRVANVDRLSYCACPQSLADVEHDPRYAFFQADVADREAMRSILASVHPSAIIHLAAESHVDRSIQSPDIFIHANILGTFTLLECARDYIGTLPASEKARFRFQHISTDEVYGDLEGPGGLFSETTPYRPSSPYSASKAASDHLVRAWHRTYGLPVLITNCSNNYGPRQYPEKLIPRCILRALAGQPVPVYGTGLQIRDWLYVEDHAKALQLVLEHGKPGSSYNIGGHCERTNIAVVESVLRTLDELAPDRRPRACASFRELVRHTADRPGHDARYAIDAAKIEAELGWKAATDFDEGIRRTVSWYLHNTGWWQNRACLQGAADIPSPLTLSSQENNHS